MVLYWVLSFLNYECYDTGPQAKQSFYVSGFLTLVRNFVRYHQINCEQLMRGGGVYIIGGLLQNLDPSVVIILPF
jgi:hypothetical protein